MKGLPIHAFDKKVTVAAEVLYRKGSIAQNTRKALAEHIGIKNETLKSACDSGRVSEAIATAFCAALEIEEGDRWWYDPITDEHQKRSQTNYSGADSIHSFRAHLLLRHDMGSPNTRIRALAPRLMRPMLASFGIDGGRQDVPADVPSNLFANFVLRPATADQVRYGFPRVLVRFVIPEGKPFRLGERLGRAQPAIVHNAKLVAEGGDFNPSWTLQVTAGMLKGSYVPDTPLAELIGASVGTKLQAELLVNLQDGDIEFEGDPAEVAGIKKHVITALMAERLAEATIDDEGWVTLGVQQIELINADSST